MDNRCVSNIRKVHTVPSLHFLFNYLRTESTTEPKYWHRSNLLSPLMNVVLSKLQDNSISYKIKQIIFNGEEKGRAFVCHLGINSNTCSSRLHAQHIGKRCSCIITGTEERKKHHLPLTPLVSEVWSVGYLSLIHI